MTTIGRHRLDDGPTVRIQLQTPLSTVLAGSLDAGQHRRGGCLDIVAAAALIGFGLVIMAVGVWWW